MQDLCNSCGTIVAHVCSTTHEAKRVKSARTRQTVNNFHQKVIKFGFFSKKTWKSAEVAWIPKMNEFPAVRLLQTYVAMYLRHNRWNLLAHDNTLTFSTKFRKMCCFFMKITWKCLNSKQYWNPWGATVTHICSHVFETQSVKYKHTEPVHYQFSTKNYVQLRCNSRATGYCINLNTVKTKKGMKFLWYECCTYT